LYKITGLDYVSAYVCNFMVSIIVNGKGTNMAEIELPELPGNSKSGEKKIKQVTTARKIVRKKSFLDTLFGGTLKSVGSYILLEVLIPAAKNTLSEMINNASDMLLFGEPKGRRRDRDRDSRGRGTYVSYTSYYDRDREYNDSMRRDRRLYGRERFNSDEIVLPTKQDADDVILSMYDIFDQYQAVSVAEFLELVGLPNEHTDLNYGWTNLRDVAVSRVPDGWVVDLPIPRPLPR